MTYDCRLEDTEFELQSAYYVYVQIDALGKRMKSFILETMG